MSCMGLGAEDFFCRAGVLGLFALVSGHAPAVVRWFLTRSLTLHNP